MSKRTIVKNTSMRVAVTVVIAMIMTIISVPTMAEFIGTYETEREKIILYSNDFSSGVANETWVVSGENYPTEACWGDITISDGVLKIAPNSSTNGRLTKGKSSNNVLSGEYFVEFKFKKSGTSNNNVWQVGTADYPCPFSSDLLGITSAPDIWFDIKICVNTDTQTWIAWVDGEGKASGKMSFGGSHTRVIDVKDVTEAQYYDDLKIYKIANESENEFATTYLVKKFDNAIGLSSELPADDKWISEDGAVHNNAACVNVRYTTDGWLKFPGTDTLRNPRLTKHISSGKLENVQYAIQFDFKKESYAGNDQVWGMATEDGSYNTAVTLREIIPESSFESNKVYNIQIFWNFANGDVYSFVDGCCENYKSLNVTKDYKRILDILDVTTTQYYDNLKIYKLPFEYQASASDSLNLMQIPSKDSTIFNNEKLNNECTLYDAKLLYNICNGKISDKIQESDKGICIKQGEIVKLFLQLFNFDAGDNPIETARSVGLLDADDNFTDNELNATYYDLAYVVYNCITYDTTPNDSNSELPVFKTMLENKVLDGLGFDGVKALRNSAMLDTFLYGVKKYPYTVMEGGMYEPVDYYYVNYFGSELSRPYFSQQQWSRDGKSFIATIRHTGANKYYLYVYNIETQTFRYIDTINTSNGCFMGDDDFVYYTKWQEDGSSIVEIWKSPIDGSGERQHLYTLPESVRPVMLHVTNDGKYLSAEVSRNIIFDIPEGTTPIFRINLENKTYDYTYYGYNYSNIVNHVQINPEYENLMFFAHETDIDSGYYYTDIQERASFVDIETGKATHVAPGLVENSDRAILFFTHENWSYNGEYLYITNLGGYGENTPKNGIVRVNKDGSHRQFFYSNLIRDSKYGGWGLGINHSYPSGDDRYFILDSSWVYFMSAETNQVFPICRVNGTDSKSHPHPVIARHKYIANWTMLDANDVMGISWYDFTDIDKSKLAAGGRYKFSDSVENIRYHESRSYAPELSCDTEEIAFNGKTALYAKSSKNIYLDINEDIIDTVNGSVKITFDYYDNTSSPLVLTYTKGVENDNDLCYFENMTKEIERRGTNSWKTAEIIIESGNFQDIGTYGTDFHISGGNTAAYIANIKVENISLNKSVNIQFSSITEQENSYIIEGILSRSKSTVEKAKLLVASYAEEELVKVTEQNVDYKENSVVDFSISIPRAGKENPVRFFVWDTDTLAPLCEKIEFASFNLTATSMANGVRLSWDKVDRVEKYEIYRDGKRIAVTENTTFDDKYFTVPEQLDGDVMKEYTTPHSYIVKCANKVSKSVSSAIDAALIKYVTSPTDAIIDFGDDISDEYVAVVTACITDGGEKTLFSVSTDSTGTMKTVPYSDMDNEINVFSAFMGRTTGVSLKPNEQGRFSVPERFQTSQDFYAYVMKIRACFGESEENNLCFHENDGLTVKSIAFVKVQDYIY